MTRSIKLAISSLAWEPAQDQAVRALFVQRGVRGVELAPLKYWSSAPEVAPNALADYRAEWADAGVSIVALQGILFGRPDLRLFGSVEQRASLEQHLAGMAAVAEGLGAGVLVFGAPGNRLRGTLTEEAAIASAAPSLRRVAAACEARGCMLCIEPNPLRYGGDFVRDLTEATRLVQAVGHPGFGLHIDSGAIAINTEPDAEVVRAAGVARHFHISEVDLVPVGSGSVDHRRIGRSLREGGYDGWLSIEMRPLDPARLLVDMEQAIDVAQEAYFSPSDAGSARQK